MEKTTLGKIGNVLMCKRILKEQTSEHNEIPFFKISTFGDKADTFISRELYEEYKEKYSYPKKGDVLISAAGTIGKTVIFNGEESYFQDSNIVWLENDENIVTNEYLYYFYQTKPWVTTNGSIISRLYNSDIKAIQIQYPKLETQQKIAKILTALDRKIALNNQINAKLEKMAKTLYDYWFVQFDFPDENGNPYKSSGGKMVWNEVLKREVPLGWGDSTLGEFAELYQPRTISEKEMLENGDFLVYGANGIIGKYSEYNHEESVVTVTCRGNSCGTLNFTMPFSWITGNAMVIKPQKTFHSIDFIYNLLLSSNIENTISGSAQPQITRANLSPLTIIKPLDSITKKYSEISNKFFKQRIANLKQNQTLTQYRDFLLPMLMNGQVEIL